MRFGARFIDLFNDCEAKQALGLVIDSFCIEREFLKTHDRQLFSFKDNLERQMNLHCIVSILGYLEGLLSVLHRKNMG